MPILEAPIVGDERSLNQREQIELNQDPKSQRSKSNRIERQIGQPLQA
jgi:hypothetical protein